MITQTIIVHVMLAEGYGGIEAAYVRYTEAMIALGYHVVCVVHPNSAVANRLPHGVKIIRLRQRGQWDISAIWRARKMLREMGTELVVTHGNRASRMMWFASRGICKQLVVLHRPRMRWLKQYDRVIAVSAALRDMAIAAGCRAERVIHIPNFLTEAAGSEIKTVYAANAMPVIGFLGRLVPEKGADILVEALAILSARGVRYAAVLGGDGVERTHVETLIAARGLSAHVVCTGWVHDTAAFYAQIDVLCVPSRAESFGFIVLEAWRAGVPVVATRTDGPSALIEDGVTGVLSDISAQALADALARAMTDATWRAQCVAAARLALEPYMMQSILPLLRASIEEMRM